MSNTYYDNPAQRLLKIIKKAKGVPSLRTSRGAWMEILNLTNDEASDRNISSIVRIGWETYCFFLVNR